MRSRQIPSSPLGGSVQWPAAPPLAIVVPEVKAPRASPGKKPKTGLLGGSTYGAPTLTPSLFSTVKLPSAGGGGGGGESSGNYLGYDEVRFPQLTRSLPPEMSSGVAAASAPSGSAELESMWMSGFLDYDSAGPGGDPRGLLTKQLGQYESRFGVRRAAAASRKSTPGLIASAERRMAAGSRGGSAAGPAAAAAAAASSEAEPPKSFLSGAEIARLRELEARLKAGGGGSSSSSSSSKPSTALSSTPYAKENAVLRRMLELRGETGGRKLQRLFRPAPKLLVSSNMDNLLWLVRLETQAAILIQRAYRKRLRSQFWKKYIKETKGATSFQAAWRGFAVRRRVNKKKTMLTALAVGLQAAFKGAAARRKHKSEREQQQDAASLIQSVYRAWRGKRKARRRTIKKQATKIQRAFRAAKGRAYADRVFLDSCVTLQQKLVRGWLSRRRTSRYKAAAARGAVLVQALFRGFRARAALRRRMWERVNAGITSWMAVLKAEEIYLDQQALAVLTQKAASNVEGQLLKAGEEWKLAEAAIAEGEYDYMSMHLERIKLTVPAIISGWSAQLDRDKEAMRARITTAKAHALFSVARRLREQEAAKARLDASLAEFAEGRATAAMAWTEGRRELQERRTEWERGVGGLELAVRAGVERRRWALKHYTETGKVDLRRTGLEAQVAIDKYRRLTGTGEGEGLAALTSAGTPSAGAHAPSYTLHMASGSLLDLAAPDLPFSATGLQDAQREKKLRLEHAMAQQMRLYDAKYGNSYGGGAIGSDPRDPGRVGLIELPGGGGGGPDDEHHGQGLLRDGSLRSVGSLGGGGGGGTVGTVGGLGRPPLPSSSTSHWEAVGLPNPFKTAAEAREEAARARSGGLLQRSSIGSVGAETAEIMRLTSQAGGRQLALGPSASMASAGEGGSQAGGPATLAQAELHALVYSEPESTAQAKFSGWADGGLEVLRPDMTQEGGGAGLGYLAEPLAMSTGAAGAAPAGIQGRYRTLGEYMEGDMAGSSSLLQRAGPGEGAGGLEEESTREGLRELAMGGRQTLAERAKALSYSRYAGPGPLVATIDPFSVRGLEKLDGQGSNSSMSGSKVIKLGETAGMAFEASAASAPGEEAANPLSKEEIDGLKAVNDPGLLVGYSDEGAPRTEPVYVQRAAEGAAAAFAAGFPSAVRATVKELGGAVQEQAALARLPPGLAGARAGAAAAALVISRQRGLVGSTEVQRSALDARGELDRELEDGALAHKRITQLESRIAATTGQAETLQYGALTKPLMDGMATLMMHLTAADGTERLGARVASNRAMQEAARTAKIEALEERQSRAKAMGLGLTSQMPPPVINQAAAASVTEQFTAKELAAAAEAEQPRAAAARALPQREGAVAVKRSKGMSQGNQQRLKAQQAEAERKEAEEEEARKGPLKLTGFLAQLTSLAGARKTALAEAELKRQGLWVEKALPPLAKEKTAMLLRTRLRMRGGQGAEGGSSSSSSSSSSSTSPAHKDIWSTASAPSSTAAAEQASHEGEAAAASASGATAAAAAAPPMDMWGYLDELEKDRSGLYAEYTRRVGFSTKASKTLGRRHLQVKEEARAYEEALQAKAREREEVEAAEAAAQAEVKAQQERAAQKRAAKLKAVLERTSNE